MQLLLLPSEEFPTDLCKYALLTLWSPLCLCLDYLVFLDTHSEFSSATFPHPPVLLTY